jgi:type I restriction enzyme R subunit
VFRDKPGGLIVDYLGIAVDLQDALADYIVSPGQRPASPQAEAVEIMCAEYEVVSVFFHGFDYSAFHHGSPTERVAVIPAAMEHVLKQRDGKKRFMDAVTRLSKAFALSIPADEALAIRDDVAFYQTVRAAFAKATPDEGKTRDEIEGAIKQLVSEAVASSDVISITGIKKPDVSILSDEFLDGVREIPQENLAMELLRKLINDEIRARARKNTVQARSFAEMLERAVRRYHNRDIGLPEVVDELIEIAREMRDAQRRGEEMGLSDAELAFYDALAMNESAVEVMGDDQLMFIARELVKVVQRSVSIDWAVKQSARAKIRVLVRRILRKYGYPPDLQEQATETVLEQAELLAAEWVGAA